jgi:hypothetical protein
MAAKYPFVILFRDEKYSHIDKFFKMNKEAANFTVTEITSNSSDLK